jgi:hypothetical protein
MLTLFGEYDERELKAFKQQWNAMVRGINNAWALPVMVSDTKDAQAHFEKFGVEFNEMYFAKWMVLLTSIVCAVYGLDPAEIYSESFSAGRSSLSGQDTAERLAEARDTGLEPLMAFIEDVLTHEVLARRNQDGYVVRFHGIQPGDKAWEHDVDKLTLSVNELREKEGRPQTEAAWGNAPVNPSLQGAYNLQQQNEMAANPGGLPGAPGADPSESAETPEEQPEAMVEESGDRDTPAQRLSAPTVEEAGDRDLSAQRDAEDGAEHSPRDKAKRLRHDPDEVSTMMRKAVSGDILVVG